MTKALPIWSVLVVGITVGAVAAGPWPIVAAADAPRPANSAEDMPAAGQPPAPTASWTAWRLRGEDSVFRMEVEARLISGSALGFLFLAWRDGAYEETKDGFFGEAHTDRQNVRMVHETVGAVSVSRNIACEVAWAIKEILPEPCVIRATFEPRIPAGEDWIVLAMYGVIGESVHGLTATPEVGTRILSWTTGSATFASTEHFQGQANTAVEALGVVGGIVVKGQQTLAINERAFGFFIGRGCATGLLDMGYQGPDGGGQGSFYYTLEVAPPGSYTFYVHRSVMACWQPSVWLLIGDVHVP